MPDTGVLFSHDIAGYQLIQLPAILGISPTEITRYVSPALTVAGIAFNHDIAGIQTIQMASTIGMSSVDNPHVSIIELGEVDLGISPELLNPFVLYRTFNVSTTISAVFSIALNVGFLDIITFGELTLLDAEPTDWDEITLSTREAKIWDGTTALDGDPVIGFYGKYRFYPRDYNDIIALYAMAGKKYTLRVHGVPYRNCMLVGKIRKRQHLKNYALWTVEIEIKQDTCMTGITA